MNAVVAVPHRSYLERGASDFAGKVAPGGCILDIKGALDLDALRQAGCTCWRL